MEIENCIIEFDFDIQDFLKGIDESILKESQKGSETFVFDYELVIQNTRI